MIDSFDGEYKENLLHAEELEYSGDYKSAAELYSHLATVARLKKDPQWSLIIALLMHAIYCFQKSNQVERANTCVDRMEKLRSQHDADGDVSIGQTLYNTAHYELICGFDRDFVNKSDMQLISFLKTLQNKAREAENEKNFRIAAARYARIGELHKRIQPIDYNSLRESLEKAGHYLNLIKSYRQALCFYQEAMKINTHLDNNEEHIAVNYNNISFIYTQLGELQEALHYCQKALAINERLQNREQQAVNISNLGQIYLKSENYDKALKNFAHAIELKTRLGKRKDIAQEMYNLGMVYAATKKHKAAIARIENAVNMMSQLNNKEEVARYSASLGDLYRKFGQRDMAIQYLEKSFSTYYLVNKKVRAAEILQTLAELYEEDENYEQLVKCIRQNIGIQESLGNTKLTESYLKKVAQIYYKLQDYKEAIGYYLKATEVEKETYTPELRYRDFLTIGLWYKKSNQRKKSIEYLQKAASILDDDSDIPQDEVYFFLAENFAELEKWSDALDCSYHAYNTTSHWYRKNIHLLKITDVYIKSEKYKDAKKCFNTITQFCQTNRQTQSALHISVTKWQNAAREHEEVQSYYLEIFTLCSMSEFYWQLEKYSVAAEYLLFAINLLKDIIAIDAKGLYQDKYNENLDEFSIEPLFDRHQRFEQQIQKLEELFVTILQQSRQDIPAVRSAISQLFNANDSLYGIEFCEQLLLTAEPYISRTNQAYFLSQMGWRFKQLGNFGKSLFYYSCSCSVYIAAHAGELFLSTLDKLNISWQMFLEDPQEFDFNSCDYLNEIIKTAYGLAEKTLFLELVEHLWNTYSLYELEEMAEIHLVKSCEMCVAMDDVERQIDFLELLSDCYRMQGKDDDVIATQVTVCDLRAKIEKAKKKEDDVFSDTYLPLDLPDKNEDSPVAENPNTLQKMGETYMSLKRYEDALLNLSALLSLYQDAEDVGKVSNTLLRISGVHFAQEHYDKALESLGECVELARSISDENLLRKAIIKYHEIYMKAQLFAEGITLFEQMLKTDKKHEEFFALETYFLANLLEKDGQILQAIENYKKALQLYEAAEEKNEHIDHLFCLQRLIDLYKYNDNYMEIIATYQKLFTVCEQLKLHDTMKICQQELYNTCWDYYQSFLSATNKGSFLKNIFDVLYFLAQNKWEEGKTDDVSYEDSVASLREACYLYDKISEFCVDRLPEVIEEKEYCCKALSESIQALGDYHMNFDNYERAIAYYEEDVDLQKNSENAREKIDVLLKLATAYEKSEDFENAAMVFDNALSHCEDICSAEEKVSLLFEAAKAYFELENFAKVREYGTQAINMINDNKMEDSDLKNEIEKLMMSADGQYMSKSEINLSTTFATSNPMMSSVTEEFRPEVDSEMSLLSYWAILRKHLILVLFCGVVGAIGAIFYTSRLPNMYRSGASVAVITPKSPKGLPVNQETYYTTHLSTQVAILQSRAMAKKVIERLPEAICLSFFGRERTDVTAGQLLSTISVMIGDHTDILYINCRGKSAENVAYIANLYVDVFIDENELELKNAQDTVLDWLKKEVPILQKKIREKHDILVKLQQEYPEIRTYTQEQEGRAISRVETVKRALQTLEMSMIDVELRYEKCQEVKKRKSLDAILSSDFFVQDDIISDLQKTKFLYENELRGLKTRYKSAHPEIKKTQDNIAQVEKQLFRYAKLIIKREERQYQDFKSKRKRLEKMLKELEEQNFAFHQKILMYEDITADLVLLREQFNHYQKKMKEYDSQRSYQFDILRPIDRAGIPSQPFSPNRTQNYLIGAFLGIMSGVSCVFLIEFLDQSIKTVEEVQQLTPARIMGFIPFISPKIFVGKTTHVVEEKENTNVAEAFRAITTSIFFTEEQTKNKTFVITSALAQDGKTTIFCNLALMMAKAGHKVLLIDCDLRRPRLRRLFELEQGTGFTELLKRDVSSEEVIHKINDNLSCIASGKIPTDPYETIHNSNIKELIGELEHSYDYILIDAPPIGITTDALLLGKKLGGLLFVITVHRTPKRMVKQLMHRMHTLDINPSGVILNDVKGSYSSQLSYYNYYGLYYTKSYYTRGLNKNPLDQSAKINPLVEEAKKSQVYFWDQKTTPVCSLTSLLRSQE